MTTVLSCIADDFTGATDLAGLLALLPHVGHIQFASVPDRGPPDHGELNFDDVFAAICTLEWEIPLGAEYKSDKATDDTLGWLTATKERTT